MEEIMKISDRILELRRKKGISQEELADVLGVSRQAVSKWESEQSIPELDKVIQMSEYFGVTTDYLLKGIESAGQNEKSMKIGNAISVFAPYMVWLGLIVSCIIWYENQNAYAVMSGFIWIFGGCIIMRIAVLNGLADRKAMNRFLTVTAPAVCFFACSLVFNAVENGFMAPYPPVETPIYKLLSFAAVWITATIALISFLRTRQD